MNKYSSLTLVEHVTVELSLTSFESRIFQLQETIE